MRRRDFIRTSAIPAVAGLGLLSLRGTGDAAAATLPVPLVGRSIPAVLGIRDQIRTVNEMTRKRLDTILPRAMAEAGIDMWIILCAEDRHDHVFKTMIPYNNWCPLTQMLVLYAKDPGGSGKVGTVERLSLARNTDMKGLHANQWDYRAFDVDRKEDQWQCLARTVKERNPKRIAVHESEGIWAASGLSVTDKRKLIEAIGPVYAQRLSTAEPLVTRWLATMLEEDLELCERAHVINHAIVEETLSNRVITPGVTTTDDVVDHYWQRALNLGLSHYGAAPRAVIGRSPEVASKRRGDTVVRRGDILYLETGLIYLRYYTDCREWAYVLQPGESDVPAGYKRVMAEVNRLQDVFCGELKAGLTGNQVLKNVRRRATALGISDFQIYSHSLGYALHEPSLIGLPWGDGQSGAETGGRGDVPIVSSSTFAAEMNVSYPIPEWGGANLRMQLENGVALTEKGVRWLDRRQTKFHIVA